MAFRLVLLQDLPVRNLRQRLRERLHSGAHVCRQVLGSGPSDQIHELEESQKRLLGRFCGLDCGSPQQRTTHRGN